MRFVQQNSQRLASSGPGGNLTVSTANLLRIARSHFEYLTQKLKLQWRYGSCSPEAYELIYINPDNIEYTLRPRFYRNIGRYGTYVLDGDWDINDLNRDIHYDTSAADYNERGLVKFKNHSLYRSMYNHFKNGLPWQETEFYMRYKRKKRESKWDSKRYHPKNIHDRFDFLDNLYSKMRSGDYLTQRELSKERMGLIPPEENEIVVSIGRDGDLIQDGGGQHRLMLAKIAEIEQVPARVFVRHEKWQKKRCEVSDGASISEIDNISKENLGHPDLINLY